MGDLNDDQRFSRVSYDAARDIQGYSLMQCGFTFSCSLDIVNVWTQQKKNIGSLYAELKMGNGKDNIMVTGEIYECAKVGLFEGGGGLAGG